MREITWRQNMMRTDPRVIHTDLCGLLYEMENAICEQEERLRYITAEVVAWRAADDHAEDTTFDANMRTARSIGTVEKARRLRKQNEGLYP
jgi:hypothetical protein